MMSGLDGIKYLLWSTIGAAVIVGLAMLPALLLVAAYRLGRSRVLWAAAVALSLMLFWVFAWPDVASEGHWPTTLFAGFTTLMPALTSAAALGAGMGQGRLWAQTRGAASVGILTAALPFMLFSLFLGRWPARLLGLTALLLTAYLALRHLQSYRLQLLQGRDDPAAV